MLSPLESDSSKCIHSVTTKLNVSSKKNYHTINNN